MPLTFALQLSVVSMLWCIKSLCKIQLHGPRVKCCSADLRCRPWYFFDCLFFWGGFFFGKLKNHGCEKLTQLESSSAVRLLGRMISSSSLVRDEFNEIRNIILIKSQPELPPLLSLGEAKFVRRHPTVKLVAIKGPTELPPKLKAGWPLVGVGLGTDFQIH